MKYNTKKQEINHLIYGKLIYNKEAEKIQLVLEKLESHIQKHDIGSISPYKS